MSSIDDDELTGFMNDTVLPCISVFSYKETGLVLI